MKICSVQAMIAITLCSLAFAHDNYGQVLDKKVTLTLKDVSIEEALEAIENVVHVKFFYSVDQLNVKDKISFESIDRPLRDVLNELLTPYGIKYKVHEMGAAITLKRENPESKSSVGKSQYARQFAVAAPDVLVAVAGRVTDAETEQPIAGVNIIVKGTTEGTTTDSEGNYTIWAEDDDVLVFSFIGYTTFEARVGGRTVIDVSLAEDIKSLKEVEINAGYYTTTKPLQTGNISKVGFDEIEKQPVSDPLATLQGRVAGVDIVQNSGVPGSNFTVRIRGTNSIASGNDPLYIIDGVPYTSTSMSFGETSGSILNFGASPLNNINPLDIHSIEVLKDADATAIYGSRGANGVILITTKKGKAGKTKVELDVHTGISQVANRMDLLNTAQYLEMRREAFGNDELTPNASNAPDLLVWDATRYTDWQDELIGGTAHINNAQFGISGGNLHTQYRIGSGYRKETTVFPGENANERVSVSLALNNTSDNEKFRTSFTANYGVVTSDMLSKDLTGEALTLAPNAPSLYDSAGNINWEGWSGSNENPIAFLKRPFEASTHSLIANSVLSYVPLADMEARVNLGYTNTDYQAVLLLPISSKSPDAPQENRSVFSRSQFNNWIIEPQLSYKRQWSESTFDILLGSTFLEQRTEGLAQYANGFTSGALMKNISAASDIIGGTNYYSEYRYHAVFGRINYLFRSRYIINLTGRRDGSSRFGPGKQFSFFKAIGLAWIFTKEPFVQNALSFLSFGKLRASYGTAGNDQISDYQFMDGYEISDEYQNIVGLSPTRLYNPDFAWEENKKLELGIELGAMNDCLLLGISYYRNRSSSQLVGQPLAPTTGFSSIQANFPATIENKGVEITVDTRNKQSGHLTWTTSFNLTIPENKLVKFPDITNFPEYDQQYVVGKPLTISKRYHYTGIDPTLGFYAVEDMNQDGAYTFEDRQIASFIGRSWFAGLQNSIVYQGFELSFLLQHVQQDGPDYTASFSSAPGMLSNQPAFVLNSGAGAPVQQFTTTGSGVSSYSSLYSRSDATIVDASFFRVKNISLSYRLPLAWLRRLHLADVRIYLQGQNVWTATNYVGLNRERPGSTTLPSLRSLVGGIHLTF